MALWKFRGDLTSLAFDERASEHLHKFDLLRPKTRPPLLAAAARRGAAVRYLSLMPEAMYVTYDRRRFQ